MGESAGKRGVIDSAEIRALAEFRYQIRLFLNGSEQAAREGGLEPQQYMFLLALCGLPPGEPPTIRTLASRMQLRHHTVVELIDRLENRLLLRRERSRNDRREVTVRLTPRGQRILSRLARQRLAELRMAAPSLVRALGAIISPLNAASPKRPRTTKRSTNSRRSTALPNVER